MSELSTLLAALRRENRQQSGLDQRLIPSDMTAAKRIGADVAAALGWAVGGWKIAANKEKMQRALRTDAPIFGRVYKQFIRQSPAALEGRTLLHPVSEAEYVVKLGEDLPPRARPYDEDEIADAVDSIHPGLEIAECRFVHDENFPPLTAIIADGSGSGSLIYGAAIPNWRTQNIAEQDVVLSVNGAERRRGDAATAIDHPLTPLTWLANELSRARIGMEAGELISTGTLTGMVLAQSDEEHVADFGPFGAVRASF